MTDPRLVDSFKACLATVRQFDHDRFLTTLIAPGRMRAVLIALYAFNAEIARVRETVSEPMLGQIRLQWWREALDALSRREVRGHEVLAALSETGVSTVGLVALIDARERDLDEAPFEDMAALEAYAEATSAGLMTEAAAAIAGERVCAAAETIRAAGTAYALTGLLRALPAHASQGRLYLPLDLLRRHDVDPHKVFVGEMSEGLRAIILEIAGRARELLAAARRGRVDRSLLPALLPASLCDRYLDMMTGPGFDPFRDTTEVPAFRLLSRLIGRSIAGRI